jgi:hypothetical protein
MGRKTEPYTREESDIVRRLWLIERKSSWEIFIALERKRTHNSVRSHLKTLGLIDLSPSDHRALGRPVPVASMQPLAHEQYEREVRAHGDLRFKKALLAATRRGLEHPPLLGVIRSRIPLGRITPMTSHLPNSNCGSSAQMCVDFA